jgi:hypothetical protein
MSHSSSGPRLAALQPALICQKRRALHEEQGERGHSNICFGQCAFLALVPVRRAGAEVRALAEKIVSNLRTPQSVQWQNKNCRNWSCGALNCVVIDITGAGHLIVWHEETATTGGPPLLKAGPPGLFLLSGLRDACRAFTPHCNRDLDPRRLRIFCANVRRRVPLSCPPGIVTEQPSVIEKRGSLAALATPSGCRV